MDFMQPTANLYAAGHNLWRLRSSDGDGTD
jgi:hypothetical protein